jgi:hypothetical protein
MNHSEATQQANLGAVVDLVHRDTTGNWVERHACWIGSDDALVYTHPTDPRGNPVAAPLDGRHE